MIVSIDCALSQYNPKGMDYELRRPITYLYNRLAYKFGINTLIQRFQSLHISSNQYRVLMLIKNWSILQVYQLKRNHACSYHYES